MITNKKYEISTLDDIANMLTRDNYENFTKDFCEWIRVSMELRECYKDINDGEYVINENNKTVWCDDGEIGMKSLKINGKELFETKQKHTVYFVNLYNDGNYIDKIEVDKLNEYEGANIQNLQVLNNKKQDGSMAWYIGWLFQGNNGRWLQYDRYSKLNFGTRMEAEHALFTDKYDKYEYDK